MVKQPFSNPLYMYIGVRVAQNAFRDPFFAITLLKDDELEEDDFSLQLQ